LPDTASEFDLSMMRRALAEADKAAAIGEVPVGCVIARGTEILAEAHNLRETLGNPTAHAEIPAIVAAARRLGDWRLEGCTLYVTLEPCPMCAGAIVNARVARVVYGADDPKAGAVRSLFSLLTDPRLNHRAEVLPGVLAEESAARLRAFFAARRKSASGGSPPANPPPVTPAPPPASQPPAPADTGSGENPV
jgi:tRNA(adenine34) deaminase